MSAAAILPPQWGYRYGEVLISDPNTVTLRCTVCSKNYRQYNSFLRHLLAHYEEDVEFGISQPEGNVEIEETLVIEEDIVKTKESDPTKTEEVTCIIEDDIVKIEENEPTKTEFIELEEPAQVLVIETPTTEFVEEETTTSKPLTLSPLSSANYRDENAAASAKPTRTSQKGRFQCDICGALLANSANKRVHVVQVHLGDRPHACDICDRRFFTNSQLKAHKRRHTGERPYVCAHCGRGFVIAQLLRLHEVRHSGKKTVPCEHCDMWFYTKKDLVNHLHVHRPERKHVCEECGASFRLPASLRTHKARHKNTKEFKCDMCEKAFNQKPQLWLHRKKKHQILNNREFKQELSKLEKGEKEEA